MHENSSKLRFLAISGSLREVSYSRLALEHGVRLVRAEGCHADTFDLRTNQLPFCNGDKTYPWPEYPAVEELRRLASRAHCLILSTPEYHGGMSGVLKNAIDLLDVQHLEGKVVGAISVLGGQTNCNALNDIRRVMRWCHAWVIPEQIALGRARTVFVDQRICDAELLTRFEQFARSLVRSGLRMNDYFLR